MIELLFTQRHLYNLHKSTFMNFYYFTRTLTTALFFIL